MDLMSLEMHQQRFLKMKVIVVRFGWTGNLKSAFLIG